MNNTAHIAARYSAIQKAIVHILEQADGKGSFSGNEWTKQIGSGVTRIMQNGEIIEKGAVNFSHVKGEFTPRMEKILGEKARKYSATGISSILHPYNPWVPIIHMNVRYFELDNGTAWFGGGIDLTPHIIEAEDAAWFHNQLKTICDLYNQQFYPHFKAWADDYYYLPHRNETRGVGGIFFDRLKPDDEKPFEMLLNFTADLAEAYPIIYSRLMEKNKDMACGEREKRWQNLRRGRYVEFNLIHDRGTKFGLESGGNTESILASLPPDASWEYEYQPQPGGFEESTQQQLKKGTDWISDGLKTKNQM